jgi:indole-3-glycerol phosphate synthase
MTVLDQIVQSTIKRTKEAKSVMPFEQLVKITPHNPRPFAFETALLAPDLSFICELKKASPSRGLFDETFPYKEFAREYEEAGAAALSVLTEPYYFLGDLRYLQEIRSEVKIPLLQKDFVLEEYQIVQARYFGADAVLLIQALLDDQTTRTLLMTASDLGMSVLTETHNEAEIDRSLRAGARIIGVNNRDLKTMEVDRNTCIRLRGHVPPSCLFVAESGLRTPQDIDQMRKIGADAVLIGEAFMSSAQKGQLLREMMEKAEKIKEKGELSR